MIKVFNTDRDEVIQSVVAIGRTDYRFALDNLLPLLDRFGEQRKLQSRSFYARLRTDIVSGCIMPPVTLAFVDENLAEGLTVKNAEKFISEHISEGYILDGMQRLSALNTASKLEGFDPSRPFHVNIIIAKRYDLLLYRMITLNNGQKPMTARHQIEMLTRGAVDLSKANFPIVTEKDTENSRVPGAFKMSDVVEAYTAYLTNNVNNQNKKIIESKLDEILVGRVMDSNLTQENVSYSDILHQVGRLSVDPHAKTWLRLANNLIGFAVGAKSSFDALRVISPEEFADATKKFDSAFDAINPSKVNVGKIRRELSAYFVSEIGNLWDASVDEIEAAFFDKTMSE